MDKKVTVYLDGVDWMYEVGEAADGNKVYPDVSSLKKYNRCWEGCGIVECELVLKKWILEHDFKKMASETVSCTVKDLMDNAELILLESAKKHLEWLEEKVTTQKSKISELKKKLKKGKK
jgi:hypothetical protein